MDQHKKASGGKTERSKRLSSALYSLHITGLSAWVVKQIIDENVGRFPHPAVGITVVNQDSKKRYRL
jgi:hypothetical protein